MWKKWKKNKSKTSENNTRLNERQRSKEKQDKYVQGAKDLLNFFIIIYCVYWPLCCRYVDIL